MAARFVVPAKALGELAVALSQEERENMFEFYERIMPEEIDKEGREVATGNLMLMMERWMRDLEDERRQREDRLRLERREMEEEVAEELAEEEMEPMRKATRQRVRLADVEEDARATGAMAQEKKEEDRKEGVTEQTEFGLVGLETEVEVEQDEETGESAESTGTESEVEKMYFACVSEENTLCYVCRPRELTLPGEQALRLQEEQGRRRQQEQGQRHKKNRRTSQRRCELRALTSKM